MDWKNTISKDSGLSDSIVALSSRIRFVKQNLVSSKSLLRIVVNKSHYPKYLVNYPFVPLTAILGSRIGSLERIMKPERIRNTGTNREHPLQWKYGVNPLQWKLAPTVEIRPQWKLRVDPYGGN